MASTYSPKLRFELVGAGEQAGLWGTTTNKNLGQLVEQAIAGVTTVDLTGLSGNYTLTALDGTADQARSAVIKCIGLATGIINLIIPTNTKLYVVRNDCGQIMRVKTAGQVGNGVELQSGEATLVFCDGTDAIKGLETAAAGTLGVAGGGTGRSTFTAGFVKSTGGTNALTTSAAVDAATELTGITPVANGGTGRNSLTANNVVLGNGTSAVGLVAPGSTGNILTSNGTTWVSSAPPAGGVTSFSAGTTGLTPSAGTTGAITLAGTLGVANGGTGGTTQAAARTGLGLGTVSTLNSVSLTSNVTGTLPVGNGGTGGTTFTANNVLLGNGTSAFQTVAPGTSGNVLTSNGTSWTSAAAAAPAVLTDTTYATNTQHSIAISGTRPIQITMNYAGQQGGQTNISLLFRWGIGALTESWQAIPLITVNFVVYPCPSLTTTVTPTGASTLFFGVETVNLNSEQFHVCIIRL